jgi:NTE family protein
MFSLIKKPTIEFDRLFESYEKLDKGRDHHDVHLVLSGSGMKMFVFLLAIYVLHLIGYRFIKVTGTSGGAIVAAALATHYDPDDDRHERGRALRKVTRMAMGFDIPQLLDPQWFFWRIAAKLSGIIKGRKILKQLKKELPRTFEELKMPCEIVTFQVNMVDPRTRILTSGNLPTAVRASMSIPFVFSPVRRGNMLLVDGGWQMNLALPAGGEGVLGMSFGVGDDETPEEVPNNIALGFKLLDGAMDEGMRRAVEHASQAELITLDSALGGLNFFMTNEDKVQGLHDGAESVVRWSEEVA